MKKNRWFIWLSLLLSLGLVLAACGAPSAPPPPTAAPDQMTPAAEPAQTVPTPTLPPAQPQPASTQPPAQPAPTTAAAPASSTAPIGLANTNWKLAQVETLGVSNAPVAGTEITLNFSGDNKISGSAGCNSYNGGYQLEGNQITIGPLATTMMMCSDEIMLQEQGYLKLLQTPGTVSQQGSNLVLTLEGSNTVLTYIPAGGAAASATPAPSAPAAPAAGATSPLANTNWKLTSVDAFGTNNAPVNGTEITLNFGADNSVNGSAGCNTYSGGYKLNGDQITIGPLISTMKACSDAVNGQEAFYLMTLQKPAQVAQTDTALTLSFDGGKEVFNYAKVNTAAPATGLGGTKWNLMYLVDSARQSKSPVLANTQITLIFDTNGNLSGNDGCNQYSGTYKVNGNQITIGPLISTMMACAPDVMQQESTYMIALQSATSFDQSAQQLILTHPAGRLEYAPLP
jgi:heat shock protein HslJ